MKLTAVRWRLVLVFLAIFTSSNLFAQNRQIVQQGLKELWPISLWPSDRATSTLVYSGNTFNHQPVAVADLDGSYLVLWNGHPTLWQEGANGQLIYASTSSDAGRSWSERTPLFPDSATKKTPATEWLPRLARVTTQGRDEIWLAYLIGRGSKEQGAVIGKKALPGRDFERARLLYNSESNRIELAPMELPPAGSSSKSVLWKADGRWWFPVPTSINQLADGTVVMTVALVHPKDPFPSAEKRFAMVRLEGSSFVLSALAPIGDMSLPDAWEADIREDATGRLVAYIRSNDIRRPRGFRHAISESSDGGRTWSACRWAKMAVHTEQPSIVKLSGKHAVLAMPDHTTNRNNQSLLLLTDAGVTYGLGVSDEKDGKEFAHTSAVSYDVARARLLYVWSQGPVGQTPNSIRFRRIDELPTEGELNLILRSNAAYELDDERQAARWDPSARRIILAGRSSAGIEVPAGVNAVRIAVIDAALSASSVVATIGNYEHHLALQWVQAKKRFELIQVVRSIRGVERTNLGEVSSVRQGDALVLSVFFDTTQAIIITSGKRFSIAAPWSLFLGDGFLNNLGAVSGSSVIDVTHGVVLRCLPPKATVEACASVDR